LKAFILRRSRRILGALLAIAAICAALLYSQLSPVGELMPEALRALEPDAVVLVDRERWITFEPTAQAASSGFIFYPGGKVLPEAYAPLARALAEHGHLSAILRMPLNLAVFNPDAASAVIAAYSGIQTWVVGGHSLGGVMAARYAYHHQELVDGLALLAAYPEAHIDISESDLTVATIYGDRDGLLTVEEVERSLDQLPPDTQVMLIEGANHAQFGWYGDQAGDRPARISRSEQHARVVSAILRIMQESGR